MKRLEIETMSRVELAELISTIVKEELTNIESLQEQPDRYLTRKQAAELLSISLPTLDKWIKSGEIIAYRPAGQIRLKASEIESKMLEIPNMKYKRN